MSKPTIVLLHALPFDETMWKPVLAAVGGFEVVAPRLYDLGTSMDEWAEAVVVDTPGPLVLVGAAMGGFCALAIARRVPERVAGLVLAGAHATADPPEQRAGRDETIRLIREGGPAALWEASRDRLFPPETAPPAALLARAHAMALRQPREALVRGVEAIRDRRDNSHVVAMLAGRAITVLGDHDPLVARASVAGDVAIVERSGHIPSMQRPGEFCDILRKSLVAWAGAAP